VHFEAGNSNKEARAAELFFLVVFAKHMTNVLTEKAFNTLAEFLHAIDVELRDFPVGAGARFESRDFPVDTVIPGNVGDKVFDAGKGLHGQDGDGLVLREFVHARFAGEARTAVDFGGAGAALPGFAVPADGEVRSEVALNVMERVENDHAGSDGDAVVDGLSGVRIAAENAQGCFGHE
jgi:hypothetical protein